MLVSEEKKIKGFFETETLPKLQELNKKISKINTIGNFYKLEKIEEILGESKVFDVSSIFVINDGDLKLFTFKNAKEKQIEKEFEKVKHLIRKTEKENTYKFIKCVKWIKELFWFETNSNHYYIYKNEDDELVLIYSTGNKQELFSLFEKFKEVFSEKEVFIDEEYFGKNSFTYLIYIK